MIKIFYTTDTTPLITNVSIYSSFNLTKYYNNNEKIKLRNNFNEHDIKLFTEEKELIKKNIKNNETFLNMINVFNDNHKNIYQNNDDNYDQELVFYIIIFIIVCIILGLIGFLLYTCWRNMRYNDREILLTDVSIQTNESIERSKIDN
jgi:hypothetical protein